MSRSAVIAPIPARRTLHRVIVAVGATLIVLNILAAAARLGFVIWSGPFAATTGFEEFCLYNIWKAAQGLPVYEWPQRDHYLLSFYNTGFYHGYGWWTRLWGADGAGLVVSTRLLTTLGAIAGIVLHVRCIRRLTPESSGAASMWIGGLATVAWVGTSFLAWMPFSARPDVPAVALALAGFLAAETARERKSAGHWLLASLLFFAAWSCKQSIVWLFTGTLAFSLWSRAGWRALALLTGPFILLCGALLIGGGEMYRYNLMEVPRIFGWVPGQSVHLLAQAMALNPFFFALAIAAVGRLRRRQQGTDSLARARTLALVFAGVPALVAGTMQLALRGSATNNIFEGFIVVALLGTAAWLHALADPAATRTRLVGLVGLALMLPLPAVQLVRAAQGEAYTTVGSVSIGNLTKLSSTQLAQRRRFAEWIAAQPKPLWTRDAMLQLPWFATDQRYPAFVLNPQFETDAKAKGILEGLGFAEWIRRRHFATLLLDADDPLAALARNAGYIEAPVPAEFAVMPSAFGLDGRAPRCFVRPPNLAPPTNP